jgi:hypothetical protein
MRAGRQNGAVAVVGDQVASGRVRRWAAILLFEARSITS